MREMLIWLTFGAAGGIQAAAGQLAAAICQEINWPV